MGAATGAATEAAIAAAPGAAIARRGTGTVTDEAPEVKALTEYSRILRSITRSNQRSRNSNSKSRNNSTSAATTGAAQRY